MAGTTTPDNIVYPTSGDVMEPLNGWFSQQAASVQTALSAMRTQFTKPALPDPISRKGADVQTVTATGWADLPNMSSITLNLSQACWVTITFGAWVTTSGGTIRASARVSGATTLGESQLEVGGDTSAWGQVLYSDTTSATRQSNGTRMVRLNAGANTITARAYRTGSGTSQVNYSTLQVSPIRWD